MATTSSITTLIAYSDSAWRFTYSEFRDYINNITDKSISIREALGTFRELRCLPKQYYYSISEEREKTVQDIAFKRHQIVELFIALRNGMQPETVNLPFKIKNRERQLINQLSKYKNGKIDLKRAHAKVIVGHYQVLDYKTKIEERSFYYWIEAAIAPLTDFDSLNNPGKIEFIGSVNGSPPIDGGMSFFENGNYSWTNKAGEYVDATSMNSLFHICGFSKYNTPANRRLTSILLLNLQTPCPEWQGAAGKMRINLAPYQELIGSVVSKLLYKIPSLRGQGLSQADLKSNDENPSGIADGVYKPYLVRFLKNRYKQIHNNPSDRITDRLTQSGCWYRTRPKMIDDGFKPRDGSDWTKVRRGFTSSISEIIKELWPDGSVTRESLGIVAKARAMLYINGEVKPVVFDRIEELANENVTDMIIVEKEGITDVLLDAAQQYRIALVATAGHFVDYVNDLMKLVHKLGRINVCVLTDYDIDGVNMWKKAKEKTGVDL